MFSHTSIQKEIDWVPVLKVPVWCRSCIVNSTSSALWELWSWYLLNHICHKCLKKDHESWVSLPSLCGEEQNTELPRTQPDPPDVLSFFTISNHRGWGGDSRAFHNAEFNTVSYSRPTATQHVSDMAPYCPESICASRRDQYPRETIYKPGRIFLFLVCFYSYSQRGAFSGCIG